MEIGAGSGGFVPQQTTPPAAEQPRRVDEQETRRAVARTDEAQAQREKREREDARRASDHGGVNVKV